MKKFVKLTSSVLCAATLLTSMAACGQKPTITDSDTDGKEIEVQLVLAGYGKSWLEEMITEFNKTYADEGYKVKLTLSDTEIFAANNIKVPKRNTTDIYFEYNNINTLINDSRRILRKDDTYLIEDLTSVWKSKAIGKDKQEEGQTIEERIFSPLIKQTMKYTDTRVSGLTGYYAIPCNGGTNGLFVNPNTLTERGMSLDDLLTTDDLIATVNAMKPADVLDTDAFFPVSWSPDKAAGYWDYMNQVLFAQYEGVDSYQKFWEFTPDSGTTKDKGYTVYQKRGWLESLKVIEQLVNRDLSVPGTTSMDHITAESRVATGKALLMVAGDYMYKELENDYATEMKNVIKVKIPVISALGVKLDLCGKGHAEGESCVDCNAKLRAIVKAVDAEEKTDAEIASDNGVTAEKVARIREARGYYQANDGYVCAMIPSNSDAKKGAKLFLRFMYSDDGMEIFRRNTYTDLPANYVVEPEPSNEKFMQSIYDVVYSSNSKEIYPGSVGSALRTKIPMYVDNSKYTTTSVSQLLSYSHSQSKPTVTPQQIYDTCNTIIERRWTDFLQQAGL